MADDGRRLPKCPATENAAASKDELWRARASSGNNELWRARASSGNNKLWNTGTMSTTPLLAINRSSKFKATILLAIDQLRSSKLLAV
nr:hypothetical protein Iba_chr14bCG15450 [Ipomoea batatas]